MVKYEHILKQNKTKHKNTHRMVNIKEKNIPVLEHDDLS